LNGLHMSNPGIWRATVFLSGIGMLFLGTSCAREGPNLAAVSGKVLVDQQPLVEGAITFYPIEGTEGPSAGAVIQNGVYRLPRRQGAVVGKNRVEIRGFRKTGRQIPDPTAPKAGRLIAEIVPALAAEYNDQSTLVRDIQEGNNTLDFDLPGTRDR
jgi:hypothetical protein